MGSSPVLAVAFVALAGLLLWLLIGARGRWWLKLALIVLVPAYGFALWHALGERNGWPTTDRPPVGTVFVSGVVSEPDPRSGSRGEIDLWLVRGGARPRAYRLPYSRQLHEQVARALAQTGRGQTVAVGRVRSRGTGNGSAQQVPRWAIRLYVLPPPRPPRKTSS